jgi:cytochrome b561
MASADLPHPGAPPAAPVPASARRYDTFYMVLHWTIALLIVVQIGLGWTMNEFVPDHSAIQASIQTLHISLGLTVLVLVVIRIGWGLTHPPPPMSAALPLWERLFASANHMLFYVLMLALPLTGWAFVSLGRKGISFWGMAWPRLPGVVALAGPSPRAFHQSLQQVHTNILIWIVLANLLLHVGGALKHQFDGKPVLWRMLPLIKRPPGTGAGEA